MPLIISLAFRACPLTALAYLRRRLGCTCYELSSMYMEKGALSSSGANNSSKVSNQSLMS